LPVLLNIKQLQSGQNNAFTDQTVDAACDSRRRLFPPAIPHNTLIGAAGQTLLNSAFFLSFRDDVFKSGRK